MKQILFVCLGNICRSPLAEGIAKRIAQEKVLPLRVESAGTSSWHEGEPPCKNSIEIAAKKGVDISTQRSRPVSQHDKHTFDYIVAMDTQNKNDLESKGFQNVYLLGDFGGFEGSDVPDPYYFRGIEGFEKVYTMIETALYDLLEKVENDTI